MTLIKVVVLVKSKVLKSFLKALSCQFVRFVVGANSQGSQRKRGKLGIMIMTIVLVLSPHYPVMRMKNEKKGLSS